MKTVLVGSGYWGKHYARLLTQLTDLRYIVDLNTQVVHEYPKTTYTTSLDEALSGDVDSVFIVTPATSHYAIAKQCLLAGKHVFAEKPLTVLSEHADELVQLANERNLRLMTGFTFLFVPSVIRARDLIESHALGTPYYITSRRTNMGPIRNDVSVVWDLVPHDVAMFLYWMQTPVISVSATGSTFLSTKTDAVQATLRFANGVIGSIFASWAEPRKVREFVIVGSEKTLVLDDVDVKAPLTIYHKGVSLHDILTPTQEFGSFKLITKTGSLEIPELPIAEPLKTEIVHFLECVKNPDVVCKSDGVLGSMVTKVLHAIEQSIAKQGEPVLLQ